MCIGFDSKLDFIPPPILFGLLLCPWTWNIFFFFGGIQHSPVNGCSATSCNFGVLTGEDEDMSFYSVILAVKVSITLILKSDNITKKKTIDKYLS